MKIAEILNEDQFDQQLKSIQNHSTLEEEQDEQLDEIN
jgi:hypothetical protein